MVAQPNGFIEYAKNRSKHTLEKIDKSFLELSMNGKKINFNSVSNLSGVSKTFLYKNAIIKKKIYDYIASQTSSDLNNVTCKRNAKDITILKLKEENRKLKEKIELLRGELYDSY